MLTRHPDNPVLSREDVPYPATLTFNAGVCRYRGRYAMVFRNDFGRWGDPMFKGTNLGLAFSRDGVSWEVESNPCIGVDDARRLLAPWYENRYSTRATEESCGEVIRFYDPRLTVLDDRVFMCFAVDTCHGLRAGVASTEDFSSWQVHHLSLPDNRNAVLFPERIGGRYFRLDRPFNDYGGEEMSAGRYAMWLSRSPDLRHWGDARLVLASEDIAFCNNKLGPGAPPVATDAGWLCIFHAVWVDESRGKRGWEERWPKAYHAGVALLDREDPSRVLAVGSEPALSPAAPYETGEGLEKDEIGFRLDVVFPGGLVLDGDRIRVYYGAADSVECLAEADVHEVLGRLL